MTAPDPAVALSAEELAHAVWRAEFALVNEKHSDHIVIARAVVAMDAELTALRARVGEMGSILRDAVNAADVLCDEDAGTTHGYELLKVCEEQLAYARKYIKEHP